MAHLNPKRQGGERGELDHVWVERGRGVRVIGPGPYLLFLDYFLDTRGPIFFEHSTECAAAPRRARF